MIKKYILLACMAFAGLLPLSAQTKLQKNVGGYHGEMDFPINWKRYYNYDEWVDLIKQMQKKYPHICKIESVGKSRMGRDQYVLTITNQKTGADTKKPAVWVDGAIHGNEVNGITCSLYLAWYLLSRYDYDARVHESVDRSTVYILPGFNVDANDSYVRYPNTENNPREPFRPMDDDGDGLYDEDMTEDVDGDGELSMMYAEDSSGEYRLSKDKKRFVKIGKDDWWEGTRFRLVGNEGFDNDGDGKMGEDDLGGIDPNRNFPFDFTKVNGKSYPLSEPETRNVYEFMRRHPNILVSFNYHNIGKLIMYMYPLKAKTERPMRYRAAKEEGDKYTFKAPYAVDPTYQHDADVFGKMVSDGLFILKDYTPEAGNKYGEHLASSYFMLGAYSYLIELWNSPMTYADSNGDGYISDEEYERWIKLDLGDDAWVIPHKVNHPQLGELWIGGTTKKHIGRTPPPRYMEDEAEKQCLFVMHCIEELPQLKFGSHAVAKIGENLYQVDIEVINEKIYPTASDRGIAMKHYLSDEMKATVSGGKLVEVPQATEAKEEAPSWWRTDYKKKVTSAGSVVKFRTKGESTTTFRYIVLTSSPGSATLSLSLHSPNGGDSTTKVPLK